MRVIIGIDPGKDETGVVLLDGEDLVGATLVSRKGIVQADGAYLQDVIQTIRAYNGGVELWGPGLAGDRPQIAVEAINAPNPHMGLINPSGAIGTAKVFGAVLGWDPKAIEVEPGGNGSGPCHAYPVPIRSRKCQKLERCACKGSDINRHLRSAWDVALRARRMAQFPASA